MYGPKIVSVLMKLSHIFCLRKPPSKNLQCTSSYWSALNGLSKISSLPFINSDGKSQIFWLPQAKEESLCGLSQHNMEGDMGALGGTGRIYPTPRSGLLKNDSIIHTCIRFTCQSVIFVFIWIQMNIQIYNCNTKTIRTNIWMKYTIDKLLV